MNASMADTSELRGLSRDLRAIPESLARHALPVVIKGAVNIKETMRADMAKSPHFKGAIPAIDFDIEQSSSGGTGTYEAIIGPKVGAGESGGHAGIAYGVGVFGGARGGGSVRDPQAALDEERPKFEKALGDLLDDIL